VKDNALHASTHTHAFCNLHERFVHTGLPSAHA